MAGRKFNNGRLNEQLMSTEFFLAYNRIKNIGNGPTEPVQKYQETIPDYSLWIDRKPGTNVMKAYDAQTKKWNPLFEGYYHPADLLIQPAHPVDGQLYIDQNGVIRYYSDYQWKVAAAAHSTGLDSAMAGVSNFMLMFDMKPVTGSSNDFLVPYVSAGKLFDSNKFISNNNYTGKTKINLLYQPKGEVSWVHVNPSYLYGVDKRLIRVLDKTNYFINVTTNNTEFYGFKSASPNPVGTLLRSIERNEGNQIVVEGEYRKVSGGIELINAGKTYDFIYAITYKFDSVDNTFGNCIRGDAIIGSDNDVFIGQNRDRSLVFLNGIYMDQADYTYDNTTGMLSFSGATITNESDLVVAAFRDVIENEQSGGFYEVIAEPQHARSGDIVVSHPYVMQVANFQHPIAFVQGVEALYDPEYGVTDEIEIDTATGTITVRNFGPIAEGDRVGICIADIGDAKLSSGELTTDGAIEDPNIEIGKEYLVFVNGICTSPSDHTVYNGRITIDKAHDIVEGDTRYVLMSLDKGDSGIDLMFDSKVSYFTLQIDDKQEGPVYNDCDMVVSYVYDDANTVNGVLIDMNCLEEAPTGEKAYTTGQIIRAKDKEDPNGVNWVYQIYNVDGKFGWTNYNKKYNAAANQKLEAMITQYKGDGSISIMNNTTLQGKHIEYLAYTYADETDEPIVHGSLNCRIGIDKHLADAGIPEIQNFSVSRTQLYSPAGKGILGTYVNGIQVRNIDNGQCLFDVDTPYGMGFVKNWGTVKCDLYSLLKAITDDTSLVELQEMKNGQFSTELSEYAITAELLNKFKALSRAISDAETGSNNELFYFVEKLEAGETYSVNRDWLGHGNRFDNFDNAYTSISYLGPGMIDIYLNGVMLDKSSYSMFNNNYVMLNDLNVAGGSDLYDKDDERTHSLIKYYIEDYDKETGETLGRVEEVICKTPDEILVEYRPDVTLRKVSYEIKETTYDTNGILSYEDYEFPASLLNTKDEIKIWIDGILYTGGYYIESKNIVLNDSPLRLDPIKEYFNSHPDTYQEWKKTHGEYSYRKSRIIFEWR